MKWFPIAGFALIASASIGTPMTGAHAQPTGILQATLGEKGMKTPEISTETMRRIVADASAMIIDSRSQAEFDAGHIPGAHVVTGSNGAEQSSSVSRLTKGDKSKALVLYCNGPYCQASRRLADLLADGGYSNVRRYQLGIPVWRALGGPVAIELGGVKRVADADRLAVFIDVRPAKDFAKGTLLGARSAPLEDVLSGQLKKIALPEDDFNRRVVLFGYDGADARKLAEFLSTRPWHNVAYYGGSYEALSRMVAGVASSEAASR